MKKENKKKNELEILLKVSKKVGASLELNKVSEMVLKSVRVLFKADYSALFLLDKKSGKLMLIGAQGFKADQIGNLKVLASWERINNEVINKSRAVVVNDIRKDIVFRSKKVPFSKERLPLKAFLAVPLKTEHEIIGVLIISNNIGRRSIFTADDKKFLYTLANHVSMFLMNARLYKNMKNLLMNTVKSLVTAVDAKDPYTHGHSERVAEYAVAIGTELSLPEESLENLRLSGLMHDVGKIGISDAILSKKTRLNHKEIAKIHKHPSIGLRIVESVIPSKGVLRGIGEHHEYFDGNGYPNKLKGKKISIEGRIIAIADAFDSLTTNRPYEKAFTAKEAIMEIMRSSGTQFDPEIVKPFQKSFSKYPEKWNFK